MTPTALGSSPSLSLDAQGPDYLTCATCTPVHTFPLILGNSTCPRLTAPTQAKPSQSRKEAWKTPSQNPENAQRGDRVTLLASRLGACILNHCVIRLLNSKYDSDAVISLCFICVFTFLHE